MMDAKFYTLGEEMPYDETRSQLVLSETGDGGGLYVSLETPCGVSSRVILELGPGRAAAFFRAVAEGLTHSEVSTISEGVSSLEERV